MGSYVLIHRTVTPPIRSINALIDPEDGPQRYEAQLLLWSTASRRAVTIWREAGDEAKTPRLEFAEWLPKTNVALLAVGVLPTEQRLMRRRTASCGSMPSVVV